MKEDRITLNVSLQKQRIRKSGRASYFFAYYTWVGKSLPDDLYEGITAGKKLGAGYCKRFLKWLHLLTAKEFGGWYQNGMKQPYISIRVLALQLIKNPGFVIWRERPYGR
jgi:hypothetical protein